MSDKMSSKKLSKMRTAAKTRLLAKTGSTNGSRVTVAVPGPLASRSVELLPKTGVERMIEVRAFGVNLMGDTGFPILAPLTIEQWDGFYHSEYAYKYLQILHQEKIQALSGA